MKNLFDPKRRVVQLAACVVLIPILGWILFRWTHKGMLGFCEFQGQEKVRLAQGVYICRTNADDAMLADEDGMGLVYGNIEEYKVEKSCVIVGYTPFGEKMKRYGRYDTGSRKFLEIPSNDVRKISFVRVRR